MACRKPDRQCLGREAATRRAVYLLATADRQDVREGVVTEPEGSRYSSGVVPWKSALVIHLYAHYNVYVRTNIILNDDLVREAMALTGVGTKAGVVHRALQELVRLERLRRVRDLRGRLRWEGRLDLFRERGPAYGARRAPRKRP